VVSSHMMVHPLNCWEMDCFEQNCSIQYYSSAWIQESQEETRKLPPSSLRDATSL
jgi:hypothetical protein